MIKATNGHTPELHPTARLAENVAVIGAVTFEAESSAWYGAVLRGDVAPIHVGVGSNLQDNVTCHCDPGYPLSIGRLVTVGHGAILHGCTIGDGAMVGMGAVLLNGCEIGQGAMVAAGALVTQGTHIPPGSLAIGAPARVVRELSQEELTAQIHLAEHYQLQAQAQLPAAGGQEVAP